MTPHVARRQNGSIDERKSRHPGYAVSLSKRWLKVDWLFVFSCAAFNPIRIPKLRAQSA